MSIAAGFLKSCSSVTVRTNPKPTDVSASALRYTEYGGT
jgi:hypothetical protein